MNEKFFCPICGVDVKPPSIEILVGALHIIALYKQTHYEEYIKNGRRIPANCQACHKKKYPNGMTDADRVVNF